MLSKTTEYEDYGEFSEDSGGIRFVKPLAQGEKKKMRVDKENWVPN